MMSNFKFSKKSLDTLSTVDGRLQALVHAVMKHTPYDFGIPSTGGKRTASEQKELFDKGWSKLDGYNKKSFHQSGLAIDIALYDEHGLCYKCLDKYEEMYGLFKTYFELLKDIGVFPKDSYIRWGFDWDRDNIRGDKDDDENFYDAPHFELRNI